MATLGGQVSVLNDINTRQKTKITSLGYPCNNLTDASCFVQTLNTVTLKTTSGSMGSLNDNTWAYIDWASRSGIADTLWSVGDRKGIALNYTIDGTAINGTYYVYILGFDHNAAKEGSNLIHFETGFTALSGGVHIAFCSNWNGNSSPNTYGFTMNTTNTNSGGWASSQMRNYHLNGTSGTINLWPEEVRKVIKNVTKYTDNTGGTSTLTSTPTATTDKMFLLSYYEVHGTTNASYMNVNEANYNAQYQYYKNGNPQVKYNHQSTGTPISWWERSPRGDATKTFNLGADTEGYVSSNAANIHKGVSPAFCV